MFHLDDSSDYTHPCTIDDSQNSSRISIETNFFTRENEAGCERLLLNEEESESEYESEEEYIGEDSSEEDFDEEEENEYTYVYEYTDESEEEEEMETPEKADEDVSTKKKQKRFSLRNKFEMKLPEIAYKDASTKKIQKRFTMNSFIERRKGKLNDFYSIDDYVAKGAYGLVCSATHLETGTVRAIKELKKSKKDEARNAQCIKEFNILKDLDHPNILRMYELFEERKHYYIVTELCNGGDLHREIRSSRGPYTETEAALLMREVLACVNYCHKNKLVHRDLKPGNILLEESKKLDQIKIIDFGEATRFEDDSKLTEIAGTLAYMAPEVLKMSYGPKCDIWSCGVIAYFVLSGKQPFKGANDEETCDKIIEGDFSFLGSEWDPISSEAKDFIQKLLTCDERCRPSAEEAMQHPWINHTVDEKDSLEKRDSARFALSNLQDCEANSRLKIATSTFIASHLLSKEDKENLDEAFRLMDIDRDGHLTKDEVKAGYSKYLGKDVSDSDIDEMFNHVDLDLTGTIEYSEFVIGSIEMKKLYTPKNLRRSFTRFDLDGTGYLTRTNLHDILAKGENIGETEITEIINQADVDGDGQISFDEFVSVLWKGANNRPSFASIFEKNEDNFKKKLYEDIEQIQKEEREGEINNESSIEKRDSFRNEGRAIDGEKYQTEKNKGIAGESEERPNRFVGDIRITIQEDVSGVVQHKETTNEFNNYGDEENNFLVAPSANTLGSNELAQVQVGNRRSPWLAVLDLLKTNSRETFILVTVIVASAFFVYAKSFISNAQTLP